MHWRSLYVYINIFGVVVSQEFFCLFSVLSNTIDLLKIFNTLISTSIPDASGKSWKSWQ